MEEIKLQIIANGMDGEGIARHNGKVCFVENAVIGDEVFASITKENKNFIFAKTSKIEKESKFRTAPKCIYCGECGGCNMQHILYKQTLQIKTQNVQNLFDKQKLNVSVLPCIESCTQYAYRNKLTLYKTKNNCLGFYQKKSNNLVDISRCELVDEKFNKIINLLNNFIKNNIDFAFVLKGVSIRQINLETFIFNFILIKKINFEKLENYLKLNKIDYSIFYCINEKLNNNLPCSPCYFVAGNKNLNIEENGIIYSVHPLAFMQVNGCVKQKIYNHILSLITNNMVVLDAYSGAGLLSALVAKKSKMVFAVEIEQEASLACEQLAKKNKVKNLTAICGDCGVEVPKIVKNNCIDIAILDPARKGVDKNTICAVVNAKPNDIIYLSCNPATLVRDLKIICDGGYNIQFVQPYDMFPNTSEVETLVHLKAK